MLDVALTTVPPILILKKDLIVATNQILEMNFFVILNTLVVKMKEIAMQIMNVKLVTFVDQIIAKLLLVLVMKLIVVAVLS